MTTKQYFELWYEFFSMVDSCKEEIDMERMWNIKPERYEDVRFVSYWNI